MTKPLRLSLLSGLLLCSAGCGPLEEPDQAREGIVSRQEPLVANDLFAKLKEMEAQMPMPPASSQVDVGTFSAAGVFDGIITTSQIDPITHKPVPTTPLVTIDGLDLIATWNAPVGSPLSVTANGQTASSAEGSVTLNLGRTGRVNWSATYGGGTRTDKFDVTRPTAMGVGAFALAAVPISVVYEPPQNLARTNLASVGFRQEMTTITTLSSSTERTWAPKWGSTSLASTVVNRLSGHFAPATVIKTGLDVVHSLLGTVETSATSGTTVNSDSSLGLSQVSAQTISTNSHLGPGRGDLLVFYKDARIMWLMEQGQITLTVIDHGPLVMVTADTLLNDLAAVKAGRVAPVTALDQPTLEALLKLDPQVVLSSKQIPGRATLPASRFSHDTSLILSGSSFSNALSHTITQTDTASTSTTSTTVKTYHSGWLSLIGVGVSRNGTETTTVSMGSSRTDAVSTTVSASFQLSAAAGESYTVEVYYDNLFGSFLTRLPPPPLIFL